MKSNVQQCKICLVAIQKAIKVILEKTIVAL